MMFFVKQIVALIALNDTGNRMTYDPRRSQHAKSNADLVRVTKFAVFG